MVATKERASMAIRRRLRELGLSQKELGARVGRSQGWVSQELLVDPARTVYYLLARSPTTFSSLLEALQWTWEEFADATGISLPGIPRKSEDEPPGEEVSVFENFVLAPVLGTAVGGRPWPTVDHIFIPREIYRPGTIVFRVEGDSMDAGDRGGIHDGDYVMVDPSLKDLRDGGIYAVEIVGDGLTVKRARRTAKGWIFVSDNPTGPVLTPDEARVVGEVYRVASYRRPK